MNNIKIIKKTKLLIFTYPFLGISNKFFGFFISFHNKTLRIVPSSLDTSIRLVPESHQYKLPAIQSTASPNKADQIQ